MFSAAFLAHLLRKEPRDDWSELVAAVIWDMWTPFIMNFKLIIAPPAPAPIRDSFFGVPRYRSVAQRSKDEQHERVEQLPAATNLVTLLNLADIGAAVHPPGREISSRATELITVLVTQANTGDVAAFRTVLLPMLRELQPTALDHQRSGQELRFQELYHPLLHSFIRRYVQTAPTPTNDWTRPMVGCRCSDCAALDRFLSSRSERVGRFAVAKKRRQHLHNQLGGSDCSHETERRGSPQTLVVTKRDRQADARRAWEARCKHAREELSSFQDSTGLAELLGGAAVLHNLQQLGPIAAGPSSGAASSGPRNALQPLRNDQVAPPRTGEKRKADVELTGQRSVTRPRTIEVIDLTGD